MVKKSEKNVAAKDRFVDISKDDGTFDKTIETPSSGSDKISNETVNTEPTKSTDAASEKKVIDVLFDVNAKYVASILPQDITVDGLIFLDSYLQVVYGSDYTFFNDAAAEANYMLRIGIHEILRQNFNIDKEKCEKKDCANCPVVNRTKILNSSLITFLKKIHEHQPINIDENKVKEIAATFMEKLNSLKK